jgi:predicted DNA-binding transcriptional regulator AlpA
MPDRTSDPSRLLLDAKETAHRVGISIRTLRRLADAGHGPRPLRVGRCLRWRIADLDAWIAAGCPKGGKP